MGENQVCLKFVEKCKSLFEATLELESLEPKWSGRGSGKRLK